MTHKKSNMQFELNYEVLVSEYKVLKEKADNMASVLTSALHVLSEVADTSEHRHTAKKAYKQCLAIEAALSSYNSHLSIKVSNMDMSEPKFKQIEDITEEELQALWPLIGGSPHLFDYGKSELKQGLITGFFTELHMDYYTMAAIVDYLRHRGYETATFDFKK